MKIESESKVLIITPFAIIEKRGIIEKGKLQKKKDKNYSVYKFTAEIRSCV